MFWIGLFLGLCWKGPHTKNICRSRKWHGDNRKVRSIVLALMTNDIQKQYNRHNDVQSIMLRMCQIYAVLDRHIRYAATKVFLGTKMIERSSVQEEHGVKMLSLVEKLKDLRADLEIETYIDVILQSLPLSFDSFIVNYNMNGLDKDLHKLKICWSTVKLISVNSLQVVNVSRKLRQTILKLGNSKIVATMVVGLSRLSY
ncbi:UNVERIFIED_CONTAM: hypothetical protein Sradi_3601200 [Sesamum radiatum]|uniref:Retrovirus-related Pol polyprotein from transposon TNT 1-94 n=1 Tax=Sesamum radiatum TaxID=300843 RepID=A0AAW2QHM3_SESRA